MSNSTLFCSGPNSVFKWRRRDPCPQRIPGRSLEGIVVAIQGLWVLIIKFKCGLVFFPQQPTWNSVLLFLASRTIIEGRNDVPNVCLTCSFCP